MDTSLAEYEAAYEAAWKRAPAPALRTVFAEAPAEQQETIIGWLRDAD